jgi:hypothetical protein
MAKVAGKGRTLAYKPPTGMRKVDTGIAGFWKPKDPGDTISGIVGHKVVGTYKGKPNVYFTFKLADDTSGPIETSDGKNVPADAGMNIGVGGAALQTFLSDHVGQAVALFFTGMGTAKKGQNAPRLYDCYEEETEAAE